MNSEERGRFRQICDDGLGLIKKVEGLLDKIKEIQQLMPSKAPSLTPDEAHEKGQWVTVINRIKKLDRTTDTLERDVDDFRKLVSRRC